MELSFQNDLIKVILKREWPKQFNDLRFQTMKSIIFECTLNRTNLSRFSKTKWEERKKKKWKAKKQKRGGGTDEPNARLKRDIGNVQIHFSCLRSLGQKQKEKRRKENSAATCDRPLVKIMPIFRQESESNAGSQTASLEPRMTTFLFI